MTVQAKKEENNQRNAKTYKYIWFDTRKFCSSVFNACAQEPRKECADREDGCIGRQNQKLFHGSISFTPYYNLRLTHQFPIALCRLYSRDHTSSVL